MAIQELGCSALREHNGPFSGPSDLPVLDSERGIVAQISQARVLVVTLPSKRAPQIVSLLYLSSQIHCEWYRDIRRAKYKYLLYPVTGLEFLILFRKIPQEQNLERSRLSLKVIKLKLVCEKNGPSKCFLNIFSLLIPIGRGEMDHAYQPSWG